MIVALVGKAGAGKTTIAEALESITPDSFVIDGDILRVQTDNTNIDLKGRGRNIHLGYSRARWLSDLGFTVFVAMQAPIKEIRDQYLTEDDLLVEVVNSGPNPKEGFGYNRAFSADYSNKDMTIDLNDYVKRCPVTNEFGVDAQALYDRIIPRVLVISRFQGFHRGHELVMRVAKKLSPNITIGLRVDEGDTFDLDKNIELLQGMGYNVVKSPNITDSNFKWEQFVKEYDVVVQGNPDVIKKFQGKEDINEILKEVTPSGATDIKFKNGIHLKYVPRIGHISATQIRNAIREGNYDFARKYVTNDVFNFIRDEMRKAENKRQGEGSEGK